MNLKKKTLSRELSDFGALNGLHFFVLLGLRILNCEKHNKERLQTQFSCRIIGR